MLPTASPIALNAKILKEQTILKEGYVAQPVQQAVAPAFKPIGAPSKPTIINEAVKRGELESLKAQAAPYVQEIKGDGHLPDIDINPGLFLTRLK